MTEVLWDWMSACRLDCKACIVAMFSIRVAIHDLRRGVSEIKLHGVREITPGCPTSYHFRILFIHTPL